MKVAELITTLQELNLPEAEVHLDIDTKLHQVEFAVKGRFLNTIAIGARVDFDVLRSEQMLPSILMHNPEVFVGFAKDRILRSLGQERVDFLIADVAAFKAKQEAAKQGLTEVPQELKEEVESALNKQTLYDTEPKKVIKKKSKLKVAEVIPEVNENEELLKKFYKGEVKLTTEVKAARLAVGVARAKEILDSTRG